MPSEPGQPTLEELSAFIDNELDAAAQARVAEHVAGCHDCQARLDGLRQTAHAIRGLPMETPPRSFTVPEQRRPSRRWAPVGWIGSGAVALLLIAVGIHNLHLPAGSAATSTSTISGGLGQPGIHKGAIAPLAAPVPYSNDQRFNGQAASASGSAATVADPTNSSRRLVLGTDSPSYATNGRMRVTIQLKGSPSTSTNSGDQGLTLTLVHSGVGVALKPVGVISSDGTPVFGGTYDLSSLPLSGSGDYRLEASWVIPDGSGRLLQAAVPVRISS
jgi:anti-sigma factor RsiW